ncbi:YceI family protein [Shewanella sp. OPT22]|nr:YceI family protein [Shewanella sp. OPT22]
MKKAISTLLCLFSISVGFSVQAHEWNIDSSKSVVSFVSVKKNSIGEVHRFKSINGNLTGTGHFELTIPLKSVDTGIAIRDERMQSMLFDVSRYPKVILSANLKGKLLENMEPGDTQVISTEGQVALHGLIQTLHFKAYVAKLADNKAMVTSLKPTIINASDFNLVSGIESLKEVAKLSSISTAIPVSFVLVLNKD